jgi:diaminopimelate epimerase
MSVTVTKMNGIGNDFLILECINAPLSDVDVNALAIQWCDRKTGLGDDKKGADGLVVLHPSEDHDFRMQIINADGSEPEMCGNAIRCVAVYAVKHNLAPLDMVVETLAGPRNCVVNGDLVRVDMGEPTYVAPKVLDFGGGKLTYQFVSMGNPHAVIAVEDVSSVPIDVLGKIVAQHSNFPNGVNVEFIQKDTNQALTMRVWERGVGETQACGTGACASLVAGVLNHGVHRNATVSLLGGDLDIEWDQESNRVFMTGPTEYEYVIQVDL